MKFTLKDFVSNSKALVSFKDVALRIAGRETINNV